MSIWHPSPERQKLVKFWIDCAQGLTVVAAIAAAALTYWSYKDTRLRELRKPYEEKQLALYLDAARVLAHLATTPDINRQEYEARFWELYWGELPFVENKMVRSNMIAFCRKVFDDVKCGQSTDQKTPINEQVKKAIEWSHTASCQIRSRWSESKTTTISVPGFTFVLACPPEVFE